MSPSPKIPSLRAISGDASPISAYNSQDEGTWAEEEEIAAEEEEIAAEEGSSQNWTESDGKELRWHQRKALPEEPQRYSCSLDRKTTRLSRVAKRYVRDGKIKSEPQVLTNSDTDLLMAKLEISAHGKNVPKPVLSFDSCNLPHKLLQNIEAAGYEIPTPVQMQVIPSALIGQSIVVSAKSGSGKTCSFLVPVLAHCTKFENHSKKPIAMVLAPTSELCIQVEEQAKLLGKGLPFRTALVVSSSDMARQVYRIRQGVSMIVGTPRRLIDLLTNHDFELNMIKILVLDEVECMIQRGFREQVRQIFRALSQPQVLMYSATVSKEVERVAGSIAKDLTIVSVGRPDKPSRAVRQLVIWVELNKKKQKLFDILTSKQHFKPPAVVFVGSRIVADLLSEAITKKTGLKALSIHGEKKMKERRDAARSFLVGEVSVLVATGVLSRGVDLLYVRQVIVFDMPDSTKDYLHMIGRASRMGEDGAAIVFVNEDDKKIFPESVDILESSGAVIPRELANPRHGVSSFSVVRAQKKRKHDY